MSSFRALREAQEYAQNEMAEMMTSTLTMLRPKNIPWLNLLAANLDQEAKNLIASGAYILMQQLIRKQEQSISAKISVRILHPAFDPDKHFGVITRDERERIVSFTPAKYDASLHKDIVHATSIWKTCIRHRELIDGCVKSLEIFADGLWELTGIALVKRIGDLSGRLNYVVDKTVAGDIVAEMFPEEVIEDVKDESEESEEPKKVKKK